MNYIYDLPQGWQLATSKDTLFSTTGVEAEAVNKGYKLSSTIDTTFFTLKVFEGNLDKEKYPWVIVVRTAFNKYVIYTTSLPAFLECCGKLLIKDVSA